jgi:hypothetical protein
MTPPNNPTCDLCDHPAVVHTTEIHNGVTTHRHLCAAHAAQVPELADPKPNAQPPTPEAALAALPAETRAMTGLAANLRGTANFIRRHGRPPQTAAELEEGISLHPPFPAVEITDPNLRTYLEESDAFLRWFDGCDVLTPPSDRPPTPQD